MKTMLIDGAYPRPQVQGLESARQAMNAARAERSTQLAGPSFSDYLTEQINHVNSVVATADQRVADVSTGRSQNLHEMMIALNKAELSMRMLTQVRNKAVEAYQELMRMSL
jgi:flagellar hook-basal body complex protein FliE